ncbi:MAG: pantetheine-phosphate adenylyltransferase [Chloroflexota bacterium]|nr:pantetheine-phosphate adenylyltransferase [Chloroflexota bacterium]
MKRTAVYPGTFDPFTNGHLDIARRAALLFDQLIVAVYSRPTKSVIFAIEERVAMAKQALKNAPNVRIEAFDGLIIDYLKQTDANVLVKGLRAVSDFEYELQMAHMNRQLWPETETVCLITSKQFSFISGSLIREIASLGGDLDDLVPEHVALALKQKFRV